LPQTHYTVQANSRRWQSMPELLGLWRQLHIHSALEEKRNQTQPKASFSVL
jgi:hypothetical protein